MGGGRSAVALHALTMPDRNNRSLGTAELAHSLASELVSCGACSAARGVRA